MKTITDIAGYLPYGLNYQWTNMKSVRLISTTDEVDYGSQHSLSTAWEWMKNGQARPILRPMSDLYVEITERGYNNGKPFVPIMKLAELIGDTDGCLWMFQPENTRVFSRQYSWCFRWDSDSMTFRLYDSPQESALGNVIPATHNLYDLLHRLKFDYRGLIDAKLAVSVHDLPTNPYEQ